MPEAGHVVTVSRRIEAPAERIFAVVADPSRHVDIDGSDMVRGAISHARIAAVGDRFEMAMFSNFLGGDYVMDNHVVEFEPGRRLAWAPAPGDERSARGRFTIGVPPGHRWIFELEPDGPDTTVVTHSYDCSRAPEDLQHNVQQGEMWRGAMTGTLERLEKVCAA
ncbi:MAG TPA: SRPBCC family protein [Mycobacteriales bacterium]|nr:SRPBCC family protein [Mycobacteriales bacterium]